MTNRRQILLGHAYWFSMALFLLGLNASQSLKDFSESLFVLIGLYLLIMKPKDIKSIGILNAWLLPVWFISAIVGYYFFAPIDVPIWKTELPSFRWMLFFVGFIISSIYFFDWTKFIKQAACVFGFCFLVDLYLYFVTPDRAGGIGENPINFANIVAPFTLIFGGCFLSLCRHRIMDRWVVIYGTVFLLGLFLTVVSQTRGVLLFFFPIVFILTLLFSWRLFFGAFLIVCLIAIATLSRSEALRSRFLGPATNNSQDYSKVTRFAMWDANLKIWQTSPLFGVGHGVNNRIYFNYLSEQDQKIIGAQESLKITHAHNQYIQLLAGGGLIGIFCYLLFIFQGFSLLVIKKMAKFFDPFAPMMLIFYAICLFALSGLTEANFSVTKNKYVIVLLVCLSVLQKNSLISKVAKSENH